ncbi:MAG: asparagine synthase (glutamine-hydrolyzing) [Hyphomicrobiaceae bacterium]
MCGLAGLLSLTGQRPVDHLTLGHMADAIAHRGPDDDGVWVGARGDVGFAHRRLSIIDPSHAASQPMADVGGQLRIAYNGEIYNHQGLRRELESRGARFRTDHSDTEVLLEGFLSWGLDGLLSRLEGMYAFALHDCRDDTLHLVRDPIGIKPLYFTEHDGQLAFASEIKALLTLPGLPRRIDAAALYHYLSFMAAPAPATMFDRIAKLPAGHVLTVRRDRVPTARRFWEPARFTARAGPAVQTRQATLGEHTHTVRRLVEAAVESHMVADVPVGVFLSGGVDSSTLLALMSRRASGPVNSFTVGFRDDPSLNELVEARDIAAHFGARHHEVLIDARDAEASLEAIVRHQDEPLADWVCIPLWHVARLASQHATKAILVGEGADELFLGYQSYKKFLELDQRARGLRHLAPPGSAGLVSLVAGMLPADRLGLRGLADHVQRGLVGREIFWTGAIAYWESQKRAILRGRRTADRPGSGWSAYGLRPEGFEARDSYGVIAQLLAAIDGLDAPRAQHSRMVITELALRLPELLLMRVDKMTMAHSLESRVPFLDRPLVEYVLGLDHATLMPEGQLKGLLKAAVAGLVPDAVLNRPKRGFAAPVATWLRGEFGRRMQSDVAGAVFLDEVGLDRRVLHRLFEAHIKGPRDLSLWLWPIINLVLWHRAWIEGRPQ